MRLVNLTSKEISIYNSNKELIEILDIDINGSGCKYQTPKVNFKYDEVGSIPGSITSYSIRRKKALNTIRLPKELDGTFYIVTKTIAENNTHRKDFIITDGAVRDGNKIIGVTGFATLYDKGDTL